MAITVHHLSCGRMEPWFPSLVYDPGGHRHLVCHCLLLEVGGSLVLVDAGLGRADLAAPRERLGGLFTRVIRPVLDPSTTAVAQIRAHGFDPAAVEHIIVTHLDLDHVGGISDFPNATVHVMQTEYDQATAGLTAHDRRRYRPIQWSHGPRWEWHQTDGERWHGFEAVRELPGLPPEVLLVPMVGHSAGHAAVAVQAADGWLMHCGDAYFHRDEVHPTDPRCTPGLRFFQWVVAQDRRMRLHNRDRLADLARSNPEVMLLCAHDPELFDRCIGR